MTRCGDAGRETRDAERARRGPHRLQRLALTDGAEKRGPSGLSTAPDRPSTPLPRAQFVLPVIYKKSLLGVAALRLARDRLYEYLPDRLCEPVGRVARCASRRRENGRAAPRRQSCDVERLA